MKKTYTQLINEKINIRPYPEPKSRIQETIKKATQMLKPKQLTYKEMSYNELKQEFTNDPGTRYGTLAAFEYFDRMDPVKALKDINNIRFILEKRFKEIDNFHRNT